MISVIVPVYKAEKYLHRCINSILAQTYTDFELILVDDGSPDNCGAICNEYAKKDGRIKVVHKENGGVTAARADGVRYSNGGWVTFVDADDTLPVDALNTYNENISEDVNIIRGPFNSFGPEEEREYRSMLLAYEEYRSETIKPKFIYTAPWGCLINRTLFNSFTFDIPRDLVFGEDMIMHIRLAFRNTKNVRIIPKKVYNYIQHNESCANTFKQSHDYTKYRYLYILESIPLGERNKYIFECINYRLSKMDLLRKYYVCKNIWKKDSYHKDLLDDIKRSNYKLKRLEKITVFFSDPITNSLYFLVRKFVTLVKLFLK